MLIEMLVSSSAYRYMTTAYDYLTELVEYHLCITKTIMVLKVYIFDELGAVYDPRFPASENKLSPGVL